MRDSEWRSLPLVAWCLGTTGTVMFVVSTVEPGQLIRWLLVSGSVLLVLGAVILAMVRARE
jgi:hypothetical protein